MLEDLVQLNNQGNITIVEFKRHFMIAIFINFPVLVFADNSGLLFPSDFTDDLGQDHAAYNNDHHYQFSGDPTYPVMHYSYPENRDDIQQYSPQMNYPQYSYPPAESNQTRESYESTSASIPVYNPYTYVTDLEDSLQKHINRSRYNMEQIENQRSIQREGSPEYRQNSISQKIDAAKQYPSYLSETYLPESYNSSTHYQYPQQYPLQTIQVPVMTVPGTLPGTVPGVVTPNYMVPGYSHLSPNTSFNPWGSFIPGTGFGHFPGVNSFPNISTFPYNRGIWPTYSPFSLPGYMTPSSYR